MKHFGKLVCVLLCFLLTLACFGCSAPTAEQEAEKPADAQPDAAPTAAPVAEAEKPAYIAGVYEGIGTGRNGDIKVTVTVSDSAIVSIEIGENTETVGICDTPFEKIPSAIIENQTLAVDAVTSATYSSLGVLEAVENALVAAGADIDALKVKKADADNSEAEAIELSADVIIVGGGGAGMSASIAAAEKGASVIVIEKGEILGGNTLYSGGAWNAVDPELQGKVETVTGQLDTLRTFLDEDESTYGEFAPSLVALKQEITDYLAGDTTYMFDSINLHIIQCYQGGSRQDLDGNWYHGDYELIKTLCENSLDTFHWTGTWGIELTDNISSVYGSLWTRGHSNAYDLGSGFFTYGRPLAESLGVEFMLGTRGTEIIMENGRAVGVKATKSNGVPVTLNANKSVIITSGGYGGSVELVKEYNNYWPSLPEEITTNNVATNTGDGIFMCREIGANLVGMEFVQLMALSHPVTNTSTGMSGQYGIYVNKEGKRFVNEFAARDVIASAAFAQTDGMFYSIDDQDTALMGKPQDKIDGWIAQGYIWKGDTVEELAEAIGIDPAALVETVNTYNSYVLAGADPEYSKNILHKPLETGPFYATPHKPNIHHTMGGVQINTGAQVLDTNGNVIPGLFAAGEVTGGIHAGNRLGGNAVADAFTFGRIAGTSAAE